MGHLYAHKKERITAQKHKETYVFFFKCQLLSYMIAKKHHNTKWEIIIIIIIIK